MEDNPIIRSRDEIKDRLYESLGQSPALIDKIYDAWRIARDQVNKANDLVQKAVRRLNGDASFFFVSLDDSCVRCGVDVTLGASDIAFGLKSLNDFLEKGTKTLEGRRNMNQKGKRGTKRIAGGYPMVRPSVGDKTEKTLRNGIKETRTCIEYIDGPNGAKTVPKFIVTEEHKTRPNFEETRMIEEQEVVDTTEAVEELPTLKIQRPSLEGKDSCETV